MASPARAGRTLGLAGLGLAALSSLACADPEDCEHELQICGIGSADCQEHVFAQTACARGHAGRTPPPVHTITRDQLEELLRGDEPPTAEELLVDAQLATSLRMLGLLPPGQTSNEEAAIQAYAQSVLAFYSRADASVTIVETNLGDDPETEVFVLSHEFVHAQQDVDVGLQDFFDVHATNNDSTTATRSVTEGEAVHYSNLTLARQPGFGITPQVFADYYASRQQALRDAAAGDPSSEVGFTDLSSLFPYSFGGELVTNRWLAEGDVGVLELYDAPPPSTAAVLRTVEGLEPLPLEAVTVSVGTVPEGWQVVADDTMGAWILYAFALRSGIGEPTASSIAEGWQGDQVVVAGGEGELDVAVAWTVRLADETLARALANVEATAPPEGARSVRIDGRTVTMVTAQDAADLPQWEETFPAASVSPEPSSVVARSHAPRRVLPRPIDDPRGPRARR